MTNIKLKTIVVDLTPVLPGGDNGGAKVFTLELLTRLAEIAPDTHFIVLTQASAHDELSHLDRANISRRLIARPVGKKSFFARAVGYIFRKLPRIPLRFSVPGYRMHAKLRRRAIKDLFNELHVDLVFCPFTAPTYVAAGIPSVCTIYDLQYKTYPSFFKADDVANRNHAFIEACRSATKLVAISDYSRQSAIQHSGLHPEKIQTVHLRMAKRMQINELDPAAVLAKFDLTSQDYLLYPANYWQHKNHEMLLTAFKIMLEKKVLSRPIKLVCTGSPGERQQWLKLAATKMQLGSQVLFADYLTNAELAVLMHHSTGMIFPSLYEGFGLPVLEAMAVGVPVACSNLTSLPEIVGDAAILFDPRVPTQIADAMINLITDQARRAQLIAAGESRVALFTDSNRMAQEYWDIFQSVVKEKKQEKVCC